MTLATRQFDQLCFICLTSLSLSPIACDREECLAVGMNDYLSKPIANAALIDILNR